ncbi:MAG: DUF1501 domain-containing protein [Planctomycetales bacterium]|nr:DUF1501 domain-containing protein [Planctomycetales bacterium]
MPQHPSDGCQDFLRGQRLLRRDVLRVGAFGVFGCPLSRLLAAESNGGSGSPTPARAKSVIFYHHYGAPSHIDTFDSKPDAPAEIRGEFATIESSAPGFRVTEIMPQIARVCDRLAVVRTMSHRTANHNPGVYLAITGRTSVRDQVQVGATPDDWPNYGAVLEKMSPGDASLPTAVQLPHHAFDQVFRCPGQAGGLLGSAYDPLVVTRDPNQSDFRVDEFDLRVEGGQLANRQGLLATLDQQIATLDKLAAVSRWDSHRERAISLLTSTRTKQAFDLNREPDSLRDRYGRHKSGQSLLLARRLVEAGVRFVTVFSGSNPGDGWDTHVDNFRKLKNSLMPPEDQAFSALIEDLDAHGLLDETLVVWSGEFGRKPHIGRPNPAVNNIGPGGRDHWPACYSLVLAGAGVKRGFVYGESDRIGEYPRGNPHTPGDMAATIFQCLGLDPHAHIHDAVGRPYTLADGEPISGIFV